MATKLNKLLTGHTITDELFIRTGSTALGLEHDTIRGTTDLEIWTGAGKTGTKLTITTDYTVSDTDTALSTEAGVTIYTKVAIVNGTYQNVNLYANYKTIGDYNDADDVNTLYLNRSVQTITTAYTVLNTDKTILINTNNAVTITVPGSLSVGFELEVQRISSGLTTNAVTLSFTGETIYTAGTIALFGAGTAKTAKYCERFVVRKITSTTWELVSGSDCGVNTNGFYNAKFDGELVVSGVVSCAMTNTISNWFGSSSGTSYFGSPSVTFAKSFIAVKAINAIPITNGATVRVQSLTTSGCTIQGFNGTSATGDIIFYANGTWR